MITDEFKTAYAAIRRPGADKLMEFLEKSDFFTAPASSRFHLCCAGGLVQHSMNVFHRLTEQNELLGLKLTDETIAICALLHDLCKVNNYKPSTRNVKNEQTGQWEKVACYTVDEKLKYGGHGSKSVFLIQTFMPITPQEATAINCHMGAYDRPANDYTIGQAFESEPLALALSVADQYATFIDERNK